MVEKIEIKKELTEIEFEQILAEFQESILNQKNTDELSRSFQELVKKITPAKEVYLLLLSETGKTLETVTLEKSLTIDISSSKSILSKSYQIKEALFSNDIERDTDYNKEIDNFLDYPLKNLLIVPLLNAEKEVLGLIWAAIPQKDWNQYMQSDIKYMMQFATLNENMLQNEIEEFHEEIQEVEEGLPKMSEEEVGEKLQEVSEEHREEKAQEEIQEESQQEVVQHQPSSMAKKIKSWFFK